MEVAITTEERSSLSKSCKSVATPSCVKSVVQITDIPRTCCGERNSWWKLCSIEFAPRRDLARLPVPKFHSAAKMSFRLLTPVLGLALLGYLVLRTGPQVVWDQVHAVGFGLALIIVLGGVSASIKTWSWRRAFTCDIRRLSWSRSFGAYLVSETFGQLGLAGKVIGEGMRVSLVSSAVPVANGISSGAIDGALHLLSSATVTVTGIIATLLLASVSSKWRFYTLLFASALVALVMLATVAVRNRWPLAGNAARAIGRLPRFHKWVNGKQSVIDSAENNMLAFYREAPITFWEILSLNFLWQALAVLEIYIVLRFMGARIAVPSAFVLEGLTKLINLVGALNPGNIGTYEGGNMLITKLFGVTGTAGLTLALCRRSRSVFWAAIGAICLILMKRQSRRASPDAIQSA